MLHDKRWTVVGTTRIWNSIFSLTLKTYFTHLIQESRSIQGSDQQTVFRLVIIYSSRTVQSIINTNELSPLSTIWTGGDSIYQTNCNTSTVACYTIKGEQLWVYKDVSVVKDPWGITVDNNSNVYLTSRASHKVGVLEPDGRQGRQLISIDDGLDGPTGIYYHQSKNSLLVTSINCTFVSEWRSYPYNITQSKFPNLFSKCTQDRKRW
jgi:hypothetical protein